MNLNLIPNPQKINIKSGNYFQKDRVQKVILVMPEEDSRLLYHVNGLFESISVKIGGIGYFLYSEDSKDTDTTYMDWETVDGSGYDSYVLTLSQSGFFAASQNAAGLYYGIQTLKQLFEHENLPLLEIKDWADTQIRSDYLDLRNIFPPFERILYFIKELSYYKINTLVVEYEDKIPFKTLKFLRHPEYSFSEEEFSQLLSVAREYFVDIIPLQQSFGHLEYVLKYPQYMYLRETPETPGEMCPLRSGALELSKKLLSEMASMHPDSRYLHIGCDEVWSLGTSEECKESGKTRERIFIEFVNQLIDHVCSLGKQPILWHDMFEHATQEELGLLDKRAIVAIWLYSGSDMPYNAEKFMDLLDQEGISYWGCSSVRCWDRRPEQNYPVIDNRLLNLELWGKLADKRKLKGMIHTNWASTFSFGYPYGLFESSRYPMFYASDISWNLAGDREKFLYRFLFLYHGMCTKELDKMGYQNRDYYWLMQNEYDKVIKNYETAYYIHLMLELETSFPVRFTMFRCELYPDSEVEYSCLKERSLTALKNLKKTEEKLKEFIPQILSEPMAKVFLESRFYLHNLEKKQLERILSKSEDM